jgi:hypothetical protein
MQLCQRCRRKRPVPAADLDIGDIPTIAAATILALIRIEFQDMKRGDLTTMVYVDNYLGRAAAADRDASLGSSSCRQV